MHDKLLGKILDRKYELIRLIGEGGMGSVYEAEHILLHHSVAVKILHAKYANNPILVERFVREAQAASAIGHPNITKAIDFGEEPNGLVYIVMELLNGENLLELINRTGRVPPSKASTIILQVLSALKHAHRKGIIHRDLKPDNVFLAIDERMREEVKLLDFGVVKFLDSDDDDEFGLTQPGTVVGTPNYLSPEQARGLRDIDARVDIWSVGVMLYESLTGELPFHGSTYNEILGKILLEEAPPLESFVSDIPSELVDVVDKSLAKEREARYQNVDEFIEALLPFQSREDLAKMSTNVIDALEIEGSPRPSNTAESTAERVPAGGSVAGVSQNPQFGDGRLAPSFPSTSIDKLPSPATEKKSHRKFWFIAVASIFLCAVGAAFMWWGEMGTSTKAPKTESVETRPSRTPPVVKKTAQGKINPRPVTKKSPPKKNAAEGKKPSTLGANTVRIHLNGVPAGAAITANRKKAKNPLEISRSKKPVTLRINAPGYKPYKRVIIPSRNKHVKIEMTKEKAPSAKKKRGKKRKTNPSRKNPKKKRGKVWTSNPFNR